MDPNLILGWLLTIVGVVLVIGSLFQPFLASLVETPPPSWLKPLIELLAKIIDLFRYAPRGRVTMLVGVTMIAVGLWLLVKRPIPTQTARVGVVDCTRVKSGSHSARCGAEAT